MGKLWGGAPADGMRAGQLHCLGGLGAFFFFEALPSFAPVVLAMLRCREQRERHCLMLSREWGVILGVILFIVSFFCPRAMPDALAAGGELVVLARTDSCH